MKFETKIFIIFIIWSLWLSLEFLLGTFSHVRIHDNGDGLLPQLIASKIQFQKYGSSYFADYMASGVDASSQFLVPFSSLNSTIFMFLPGWLAYGLLMFLQRFLASYFTYRLCKDILDFKTIPSIFAGILFSLLNFTSYSFTLYHQLGLPAVSFILWSFEKIFKKETFRNYLLVVLLAIFVGFSSYFAHSSPYLFIFILVWFFFLRKTKNRFLILSLFTFFTIVLFVQLESILQLLAASPLSQRTSWDLSSESFYPQGPIISTLKITRDNVLANSVSILIIIIALFLKKTKQQYFKKLLFVSILFIIFPASYRMIQPNLVSFLGSLVTFPIYRMYIFIPFCLSLTAASALVSLLQMKKIRIVRNLIVVLVTILLISSVKIKIETVKNYAPYRSLYMHPDLVNLSNVAESEKWRIATVTGGGIRPSYALANGLSTVDTYITLYPETYHQYWSKIIAKRIEDDKAKYDDFVKWGNRIYLYGPEDFYNLEIIEFNKYFDLDLLSQANVKFFVSQKPISDPDLKLLPSEYKEKIANWDELSKLSKLLAFIKGKYFGPPLYIYENQKALPRFFVEVNGTKNSQGVKVVSYSPDRIELTTDVNSDAKLIALINYYPFWKFSIDGLNVDIERYQGTFMSVNISRGKSNIVMEYQPNYRVF